MKQYKGVFLGLLLIAATVWLAVWQLDDKFHLVACNVGQGDAVLVMYKNSQILIDGGPDAKVVDCLSRYMPFWDRKIELVILTHPEADHFTGLIEVFKSYGVDVFLKNSQEISNQNYEVLKAVVGGSPTRVVEPVNGMVIRVGLIDLDIVIDEERSKNEKLSQKNLQSIIAVVDFGSFEAVLTGDYEFDGKGGVLGDLVLAISKQSVDYIKIPHHGSKNGLTRELLEITHPKLATISVGKNQWGHPAPEILKMLADFEIMVLRTDLDGDIEVISDGKTSWIAK